MALYAVIMAGGRGERFWPASTPTIPKPFIPLLPSGKSLIQATVDRLEPLISPDHIFISIGEAQLPIARNQLPDLPSDRFIIEPVGRDTSACLGYCALHLERFDSQAVMLALPADHFIKDKTGFQRTLQKGLENLSGADAVIFGIKPKRPETGYGYVQAEKPALSTTAWKVRRFVEKPGVETAREYLRSGDFFWNSGMFLWEVPTLLRLFAEHLPATEQGLQRIRPLLGRPDTLLEIGAIFSSLQRISIDFGILEKITGLRLVPAEFDWDDIGNWAAIERLLEIGSKGNVSIGPQISLDSKDCIFYSDGGGIAAFGVKDLVIVQAQGKVLVCPKDRAADLKRLVALLGEES